MRCARLTCSATAVYHVVLAFFSGRRIHESLCATHADRIFSWGLGDPRIASASKTPIAAEKAVAA